MHQKNNTNFYERVYDIVRQIPKGKVMTYGQIAKILNAPKYSQIVGFALHQNPDPKNIPCHRVVDRFGNVAKAFAFGGVNEQKRRLEKEGVVFYSNGRIDLKKYGLNTMDFIIF